jgi:hypothetical protein
MIALIPNSNREDNAPTAFLRLREFNQCHAPAGTPAGGTFCSTAGDAQLISAGQKTDIHGIAAAGGSEHPHRLILFDPTSRDLIVGGAGPEVEKTHAEAGAKVFEQNGQWRYDKYPVHGYLIAKGDRLGAVQVSRIARYGNDYDDDSAGQRHFDVALVQELADRLRAMGAGPNTRFVGPWGNWPGTTLGEAFPEVFGRRKMREFNNCHNPEGAGGGQFCSTRGSNPKLMLYSRPPGSKDLPDFLKADVVAARRAGIEVFHAQQPEPVMGLEGQIHDPLAMSHARGGESRFFDKLGSQQLSRRGRVYITTRGGEFEPEREVWDDQYGFRARKVKKDLTPEMLPEALKATVLDVVSTFRHEVGHIMDDSHVGGKIGTELAREIRAWQYAMEATPDHRISQPMLRRGLESHAYTVFRKQALPKELSYLSRTASWELDETLDRIIQNELRSGVINIEATRKAKAFADKTIRALDHYGTVLRKRGIVRVPQPLDADYFGKYGPKAKVIPGPGGRSQL